MSSRGKSIRRASSVFASISKSPYRPGEKINIDEYYRYIFERVPGLPQAASAKGLDPLAYMRKYGAFEVVRSTYARHERKLSADELKGTEIDAERQIVIKNNMTVGVARDDIAVEGFPTPSRRQEIYSQTMVEWGWPEYATPGYIPSHVDWREMDLASGEFCLLPTFRLPTLIHSRSGAAKWLNEISHRNPLWMHPTDVTRLGLTPGDLVRVETEIGYFVDRIWITESIRPGVAACSHHLGRWRREQDADGNRWSSNVVTVSQQGGGKWHLRQERGPQSFESNDLIRPASGGATAACRRISHTRYIPTQSAACTVGTKKYAFAKPKRPTNMATFSSTPPSRTKSTSVGSPRPDRLPALMASAARSG